MLDKRVFVKFTKKGTSINTKKYWLQLLNFIDSNYKNWNNCIFIIKGDGATWIKNLASYFNGYYVLDKFHLIKRLRSALSVNVKNSNFKEIQQIFKSASSLFIKNTNYTDLFTYLRQTYQYLKLNKLLSDDKLKDLRNFLNYIASNKTHILNYHKDFDSCSHTEGQISSVIKQTLGYNNKIYNYYNFKKIMFIKLLRINKINISEAIFYNKKAYIDKKRQENFEDYTHYHNIFDYINKKEDKNDKFGQILQGKIPNKFFFKGNSLKNVKKNKVNFKG